METKTKNIIGGIGLIALLVAGVGYVWSGRAGTGGPDARAAAKKRHPALEVDISAYNADQIIAFVRGLGDLTQIVGDDRVALFNKLKERWDKLPGVERAKLLVAAMEVMEANKNDALMVNTRELMRAYWHVELTNYIHADPAGRKAMIDKQIQEQQDMENLRSLAEMFGMKREDRATVMRRHISDSIQDSFKNSSPEDRAMMTQFMLDIRKARIERKLPVMF